MHLRRSLALLTGTLVLTAPLAACGFDPATNRVNNIVPGTNDRDSSVDVLGAVIVSAEEGSGTFVASFANNDLDEEATVSGLTAQEGEDAQVADFTPIELAPNELVNLAQDDQGVEVQGDFGPGDRVRLAVELGGGEVIDIDVPVMPNCDEFEGIDGAGGDCEVAEPEGSH
ncbi:MAG TPA: hypothetical protein VD814_11190 [Nocardioides sp.]|nr:hypothetical protein [Nocardioides sp.]